MSTMSFLFLQQPSNLARFGLWIGYFFSINVVIGSGFLTLPHSFDQSGWLLALIFMILLSLQTYYIGRLLIEVFSRVECLKQLEEVGIYIKRPTLKEILKGTFNKTEIPEEIQPIISDRRFDVSTIAGIIFGQKFGVFYMVCLYFFLTGSQVSYVSIFSSSFAATIPLGFSGTCNIYDDSAFFGNCRINYWFFLAIFFGFMMYLTLRGLREQKWMQTLLTMMRFVIIFLMVGTSIALIAGESNIKNNDHTPLKMPPLINFRKILSSLPNIMFAFIYQLQFPSIVEFIKDKEANLKKIVFLVGVTSLFVYLILAMLVPIAIHDVKPQCSIEYSDYSAGYSQSDRPWWTYIISYIIVLFPALDVFSAFTIMAITVSDNLLTLVDGASNEDFIDYTKQRKYRIMAVTIPFFVSFFMYNLEEIISWVGMVGFLLVPICMPLFHLYAREMIPIPSKYDAPFYSKV